MPAPSATETDFSPEDLPTRLGLAGHHCAVVGLQWGDEGKGKIVDLLTPGFQLVVRYNGGANAGHSVVVGDERYALHLIPSGILYADKLNVLGNGLVVDPEQLVREMQDLRGRGVTIGDNLRVSDRSHLVLPYHQLQDGLMELALGARRGDDQRIGTTGRGIGPAYADKALRGTAIRMGELLHPDRFRQRVQHVVTLKNVLLSALARHCDQPFEPIDHAAVSATCLELGAALRPHICDTTELLHGAMAEGQAILFEGANATLLDLDHGTFPFVTSSSCSSLGVHTGAAIPGSRLRHVVGIAKAYQTRVGGGPMVTELCDATGNRIREAGHEYGTTTGRPRRCGWLDLVAVRYGARVSGASAIGLMLLDVLADLGPLSVCVAYAAPEGGRSTTFPADAVALGAATPVYEQLEGFAGPIGECRRFEDLPEAARAYVRFVEQYVQVPVRIISVGPRRDQTIVREA